MMSQVLILSQVKLKLADGWNKFSGLTVGGALATWDRSNFKETPITQDFLKFNVSLSHHFFPIKFF